MSEVMSHRSSYIAKTDYDRYTNTLIVDFTDGRSFQYEDVPLGIYHALITSASIGRAFRSLIYDSYEGDEI